MIVPGWKRSAASFLFLFLFISSVTFGVSLFIRTYEVLSFNGQTVITGQVLSTERIPLEGVEISCGGSVNRTGDDGNFFLEGVPEGEIRVTLFKPGHLLLEVRWLAYPLNELGGPLEGSVNNISRDIELVLYREFRTEQPYGPYSNGTLDIIIRKDMGDSPFPDSIRVSNGTKFITYPLLSDRNEISVIGNGTFMIRTTPTGPVLRSFHPVGCEVDVTDPLLKLITDSATEWHFKGSICLNLSSLAGPTTVLIEILAHDGTVVMAGYSFHDADKVQTVLEMDRPTGVYTVRVSGKDVIDMNFEDIPVTEGGRAFVNISLASGGKDVVYEGLKVEGNYHMAALNIVLGSIFLLGAVLALRDGSWFMMVPIALMGFISNGIIPSPIDLNHIVSSILLITLMLIFKQERTRRRSRRS